MKRLFTSSSTLWSCFVALAMMMTAQSARAEYVKLKALSGTGGTGGEGYASLVDAKIDTKMGHSFDPSGSDAGKKYAWIVVKAEKAVVPENYFLVTGGDTGSYPDRNWKSWKIFGANFESEDLAVRGNVDDPAAGGWTLIDEQSGVELPKENTASYNLQFSEEPKTAYQYYWIEILESVAGGDIWLQMGEWGIGTYGEFQAYLKALADQSTTTDEPIKYSLLSGSPAGFGGEGVGNLIDGKTNNKWCTGFTNREEGSTENGAYIVFKSSRSIAPTYYSLITGNDTGNSPGRNWKKWRVYGMNADSDEAVSRESSKWVLLDDKENVTAGTGLNQLPAANYAQGYFTLTEDNATAYRYFKIEIDQCVNDGLMQMTEFSLGDEFTLAIDRNTLLTATAERYNPEDFAEKALYDQMDQLIASINAASDPVTMSKLTSDVDALVEKINASKNQYANLITARNSAVNQIADDNLVAAALTYVNGWISETDAIAPNNEYPCGNYAYIVANRQLTGEEAAEEAKRFTGYLQANAKTVDDPIGDVTYEYIDGTQKNWADGESPRQLIDGDRDNTKWGMGNDEVDRFIIFKAGQRIKPTYYGLVTGGDTSSYPDRNWRNWKIWGANFAEPLTELDPTADDYEEKSKALRESANWVLIDEKENVGTDVLKTTSKFESYINLSVGCSEPYEYFMIQVFQKGGMQMNEFNFYNMGDLVNYRADFIDQFSDYDPEAETAYKGYTDAYKKTYTEMCNSTYAPDLMKFKNELMDLQEKIAASAVKYSDLAAWYEELVAAGPASEELEEWFNGYTQENIAPNSMYINGTYEYILENRSLDDDAIGNSLDWDIEYEEDGETVKKKTEINPSGEIGYIESMINAAQNGTYVLLGGHTVSQWGDGFYGHLIDGIALNSKEIDPETGKEVEVKATKWGGAADANGDTYIIFRTLTKTNPFFYTLTTGNDTGVYTGRNWGTWYIYGANFAGDAEATKDAEGWVLVDSRENVGQDRLHPVNAEPSYFGFSTETTEPYTYYKVVVTKAYSGNSIQMNELHFGTAKEFQDIKDEYETAARDFNTEVIAEQALIDKYKSSIDAIDGCANMEALFRANYVLETLRDSITTSAAAYVKFEDAVEEVKAYLGENALADSEAKTLLDNYLAGEVAPSEAYPNGSYEYIIENHVLADSVVLAEIEFLNTLKVAAVAKGYGPGMDISDLIVNRTFAKAGEMLKDKNDKNIGREAEGWNGYIYRTATDSIGKVYAAEFCNEVSKFDIKQTLSELKNGYYKVTLNAGFRANGNLLSYNYAAMAYANDTKTFVPVVREDAVADSTNAWMGTTADKMICNADTSEVYGIGIWGCEGAAHAFGQGRYAITLVAQVTDGTLTIGVKNEGTTVGGDWLAAGNFGLTYLGEQAPAEAIAEAAAYNGARATTLTEIYSAGDPYTVSEYKEAPGFSAAQGEALLNVANSTTVQQLVADGELFAKIYATKAAYYNLLYYNDAISFKWDEFSDACNVKEDCENIVLAILDGEYADDEAANKVLEDHLAKYPDYLKFSRIVNGACDNVLDDVFNYDLTSSSAEKSVTAIFSAAMYDDLKDSETILEFEYKSDVAINDFTVMNASSQKDSKILLGTLEATSEFKKVTVDVKNLEVKSAQEISLKFNTGVEGSVVAIRRVIFVENSAADGDLNGDGKVTASDIQVVLNAMADDVFEAAYDLNGDGKLSASDIQVILNIIAEQ